MVGWKQRIGAIVGRRPLVGLERLRGSRGSRRSVVTEQGIGTRRLGRSEKCFDLLVRGGFVLILGEQFLLPILFLDRLAVGGHGGEGVVNWHD